MLIDLLAGDAILMVGARLANTEGRLQHYFLGRAVWICDTL